MNINIVKNQLSSKWVVFILLAVFLLIVILLLVSLRSSQNQTSPTTVDSNSPYQGTPSSQEIEVQNAINEQLKVDNEYADWQNKNATEFPWLKKLPLVSDRYYVYYDLAEKKFIGRLYPRADDSIDQLKNSILAELKGSKGIPVGKYVFEWKVLP